MKNCPNCNAPIDPNTCKCGYCGTYYFDFSGLDLSGNKPCFIRIGDIILKAFPYMESFESHLDYDSFCDISGRMYRALVSKNVTMQVTFDIIESKET